LLIRTLQTDVTETTVLQPQNGVPTDASIAGTMIVFEGVTKVYDPNVVALNDVSFVIEKGEFVFVVGASGSGKSTMIRLLLKELEPSAGRIFVGGRDLTRLKHSKVPLLRRNVGCVFQDFKLLPNRTAAENLDPDTSVGIMQLLYRINRAGTTILMVTHDREMVDKMRRRVIALEDGRLARDERRGGYESE
jgi:ABC-type ATPase involved in cell division